MLESLMAEGSTGRMTEVPSEWKVLAHEPIVKLTENLWWVRGALPKMTLKRVMVVVRLHDGNLLLHSPIALDERSMAEIEAFGKPAFIVVPNAGHRLDVPAYKRRYPEARVYCPRGGREKIERVVQVDGCYEDFPRYEEAHFERLQGIDDQEGVLIVRSSDGVSVILNDCMFNMDRKRDPLGFFFTTLLGSAPGPRVSRLAKLVFVKDKRALRADFERLAALPDLVRVIVAHEKIAHGAEARSALVTAAGYL